jgi:hypothetical protein
LRVGADAEASAFLHVLERVRKGAEAVLAQSEHHPRRADGRIERRRLAQRRGGLGMRVAVIEQRPEMEPALGPSRPRLQRLPVERHRLAGPIRGARRLGLRGEACRGIGGGLAPGRRHGKNGQARGHRRGHEPVSHVAKHHRAAEAATHAPPPFPIRS